MTPRGVDRLARVAVGLVLLVAFFELADARRALVRAITGNDAAPGAELRLPAAEGDGLGPAARVRVVLIDGAGIDTARSMPTWDALCARGVDVVVDVGFPTVSLPVQVALWSGRSQQASGILFHSTGQPLDQSLGDRGLPGRIAGSIAVAESAPYIVHSLGFAEVHPPGLTKPDGWAGRWLDEAATAFASDARLAFVHILKIDVAGHRTGKRSPEWGAAAALADVELARLLAAAPADARWFVLADHDHLPGGGHGGEERDLRLVRACIAGPGIAPDHGGPLHITDLSRALADSLGLVPDAASPGRPLGAALTTALSDADVLPRLPPRRWGFAAVIVMLAVAATGWSTRGRPALLPWWFLVAVGSLVVLAQVPTLSTPMIYPPKGLVMAEAFAPGLAVLAIALAATTRRAWGRALVGQLLVPAALTLAGAVLIGALPLVLGDPACPVVPRFSAWMSPMMLMMATGVGVAGLVVLASAALPWSGPSAPPETRRTAPAAP